MQSLAHFRLALNSLQVTCMKESSPDCRGTQRNMDSEAFSMSRPSPTDPDSEVDGPPIILWRRSVFSLHCRDGFTKRCHGGAMRWTRRACVAETPCPVSRDVCVNACLWFSSHPKEDALRYELAKTLHFLRVRRMSCESL